MKTHLLTKKGLAKLQKEYEDLQSQRPDALEHLKKARELGDLSENGYYKASRAKLSFIDGRMLRIKTIIKYSSIINATTADIVTLGCTVVLKTEGLEKTYKIVGEMEANPKEGTISNFSPIGKALLGKRKGDKVIIHAPAGTKEYTIEKISIEE